jgi:hypothetical protein
LMFFLFSYFFFFFTPPSPVSSPGTLVKWVSKLIKFLPFYVTTCHWLFSDFTVRHFLDTSGTVKQTWTQRTVIIVWGVLVILVLLILPFFFIHDLFNMAHDA